MSIQNPAMLWFALLLIVPLMLYLLPLPRRWSKPARCTCGKSSSVPSPTARTSERFRRALGFALLVVILASLF